MGAGFATTAGMSDQVPPLPPENDFPQKKGWKAFFESPAIPYPDSTPAEKSWATGLHASGFAGLILVIPAANIIAPLVIWLIKRPESKYLDEVGKEVVNFHISMAIYMWISVIMAFVLGCLIVPLVLPVVVAVGAIVYMVMAVMKTSEGGDFRYPATIRFIK